VAHLGGRPSPDEVDVEMAQAMRTSDPLPAQGDDGQVGPTRTPSSMTWLHWMDAHEPTRSSTWRGSGDHWRLGAVRRSRWLLTGALARGWSPGRSGGGQPARVYRRAQMEVIARGRRTLWVDPSMREEDRRPWVASWDWDRGVALLRQPGAARSFEAWTKHHDSR
jgi:hypothetical protein